VWTISSLIAASTRHYLLWSIIDDHPTLRSLVLADADGQGMLSMGMEQLKEFRENQLPASACSNRTQVPACSMKLKYAPYLELPGGLALQGTTLVVIKPSADGAPRNKDDKLDFRSLLECRPETTRTNAREHTSLDGSPKLGSCRSVSPVGGINQASFAS
jgi:hypothetical protein